MNYELAQGSDVYELEPLGNDRPIEDVYGYQGGSASGSTIAELTEPDAATLFLWEDLSGLSLVLVQDEPGDATGGESLVEFDLPTDGSGDTLGEWVVQDDPASFESPTDGRIDWQWTAGETAGGAFRGGVSGIPFGQDLVIDIDGRGPQIPLSNPWHYKERYDRPVEGYEPPVWVYCFADNADDYDALPPADQPRKNFEVRDGEVHLTNTSSDEPANDLYVVLSPGVSESTLKFVGEGASLDNRLLFRDRVLIENANDESVGTEYTLPGLRTGSFEFDVVPESFEGIDRLTLLTGSVADPRRVTLALDEPLRIAPQSDPVGGGRVSASVTTLQAIPGTDENRTRGGDPLNSALPKFFEESDPFGANPLMDSWFQGDMTDGLEEDGTLPVDLEDALAKKDEKYELFMREEFNRYRFDNGLTVEFDVAADGSVDEDSLSIEFAEAGPDPDDPTVSLAGKTTGSYTVPPPPDYEHNHIPYDDWFDGDLRRQSHRENRYYRYDPDFEYDGVSGVRVTTVAGGFAGYAQELSRRLGNDPDAFLAEVLDVNDIAASIVDMLLESTQMGQALHVLSDFGTTFPPTYTFLEVVVLVDGRRFVRVWDATPYPDLYVYVDGERRYVDEMDYEPQQRINFDMAKMILLASLGVTPYKSPFRIYEGFIDEPGGLEGDVRDALDQFGFDDLLPTSYATHEWIPDVPRTTMGYRDETGTAVADPDGPFADANGLLFLASELFDRENAGSIEYE